MSALLLGRMRRYLHARARQALVAAVCLAFAVAAAAKAQPKLAAADARHWSGVVIHVTDGDTLWVRPEQGGAPRKIRLDGIDAPEICQTYGVRARSALQQRLLHRSVTVAVRRIDDYRRPVARLRLQGEDISQWMVQEGHAWSYRYRRNPGPYAAEELAAQAARRGLFADARAERPRAFRQQHGPCERAQRAQRAPAQTGQRAWRGTLISVHSMVRASTISSRPVSGRPAPDSSFSASAACMLPTMPTSGANTPSVAQRVSSSLLSGANMQA